VTKELKVHVDRLTFGKWAVIDRVSRGEAPVSELIKALDGVVEGGVEDLPITALNDIVAAITEAVNAKNSNGGS